MEFQLCGGGKEEEEELQKEIIHEFCEFFVHLTNLWDYSEYKRQH